MGTVGRVGCLAMLHCCRDGRISSPDFPLYLMNLGPLLSSYTSPPKSEKEKRIRTMKYATFLIEKVRVSVKNPRFQKQGAGLTSTHVTHAPQRTRQSHAMRSTSAPSGTPLERAQRHQRKPSKLQDGKRCGTSFVDRYRCTNNTLLSRILPTRWVSRCIFSSRR